MDPISLIVGVIIFVVGMGTGRAMGAITKSRGIGRAKDPNRCLCGHAKAFHTDKKGCNARNAADPSNSYTCRCMTFVSESPEGMIDWSQEFMPRLPEGDG